NMIQTVTRTMLKLKRNSKKQQKPMKCSLMVKSAACTTVWAIRPLKVVWAAVVASAVVSAQKTFSASSVIFSVVLLVAAVVVASNVHAVVPTYAMSWN